MGWGGVGTYMCMGSACSSTPLSDLGSQGRHCSGAGNWSGSGGERVSTISGRFCFIGIELADAVRARS